MWKRRGGLTLIHSSIYKLQPNPQLLNFQNFVNQKGEKWKKNRWIKYTRLKFSVYVDFFRDLFVTTGWLAAGRTKNSQNAKIKGIFFGTDLHS